MCNLYLHVDHLVFGSPCMTFSASLITYQLNHCDIILTCITSIHVLFIIVLSQCPQFHELDLITCNQKAVRVLVGSASKWDRVATRLHFDGNIIAQIGTASQNNQLRACQSVFTQWLDGTQGLRTPRTWNTIIEVLKEADLCTLAENLRAILEGNNYCHHH